MLLSLALLLSLCACGEKVKTITIDNETGYVIGDLRMSAVYSGEWGPNRLEQMLYDTESAVIALGDYTDEELIEGYSIQLFDDYDNSFGAADGILVESGDTLTLFMSGGILAWSLDGSFTVDEDWVEPAEGDKGDWSSTQPEAWETEEYLDEDSGVRMTYPAAMTAWSQDGAIFVAGSGCGVTVRDVEAAYNEDSGDDGDFLYSMQTNCLMEDFEEMFGDGTDIYFSSGEQDDRFSWSMAEFHADLHNDSAHVNAFGLLFADDTGRVVYKCFYAPYGDDAAMEYLLKNVCNFGPA